MRNKKKKMVAGKDEDSALQEAMENVRVVNGLEHKISCHTFKVSYVLDTEDLFFRSKAGRADKQKAANREAESCVTILGEYCTYRMTMNHFCLALFQWSHEGTAHHVYEIPCTRGMVGHKTKTWSVPILLKYQCRLVGVKLPMTEVLGNWRSSFLNVLYMVFLLHFGNSSASDLHQH